jgi:hypothetical protein
MSKIRTGYINIGSFLVDYEIHPPDRDTGDTGYVQVTKVEVGGVDIYDDLDAIPDAILHLEAEITELRKQP